MLPRAVIMTASCLLMFHYNQGGGQEMARSWSGAWRWTNWRTATSVRSAVRLLISVSLLQMPFKTAWKCVQFTPNTSQCMAQAVPFTKNSDLLTFPPRIQALQCFMAHRFLVSVLRAAGAERIGEADDSVNGPGFDPVSVLAGRRPEPVSGKISVYFSFHLIFFPIGMCSYVYLFIFQKSGVESKYTEEN